MVVVAAAVVVVVYRCCHCRRYCLACQVLEKAPVPASVTVQLLVAGGVAAAIAVGVVVVSVAAILVVCFGEIVAVAITSKAAKNYLFKAPLLRLLAGAFLCPYVGPREQEKVISISFFFNL